MPDVQVYYRGIDPTPIREFVMKDWNDITNFGGAVCLPGDVVFGAGGGVLFIPSHLVADVVEGAAKTHVKDDFGFEMICKGANSPPHRSIKIHGRKACSTCCSTG